MKQNCVNELNHCQCVETLEGHLKNERLDAGCALRLEARSVDFAAVAHPHLKIEQYLRP